MLSLLLTFVDDESNENDFINLYKKYKNYIYKLCFDLVKDHYLAEDCLQETFIIVAKNFYKIDSIESKRTKNFIITIAKCVSMKVYNKSIRNDEAFFEDTVKLLPFRASAEDEVFNKYTVNQIYDSIMRLDDNLKLPLILKDYYNFKHKDIAEILGISAYAARRRLARAKEEIRKDLEREEV